MALDIKSLMRRFFDTRSHVVSLLFVIAVLAIRLYKIDGFTTFLGDQGRDAIIIKDIVTLTHWPAIGAITSIGQIFLGPFYYYFIAPWLLLFNFDPVGLAVGVAVTSSILLYVIYRITYKLFSMQFAWFVLVMSGTATVMHEFSRFSWNPNLLPLVSFLVSLIAYHLFKTRNKLSAIVLGALLSIAIQLHYIALILLVPTAFIFLFYVLFEKKNRSSLIKLGFYASISFMLTTSPLIMFDLRHDFLNSKNFIHLFTQTQTVGSSKIGELISVFQAMMRFIFTIELTTTTSIVVLTLFFTLFMFALKKNRDYAMIGFYFLWTFVGLSLYSGPKYSHYLAVVYLYFFASIWISLQIIPSNVRKVFMAMFLIGFSFFSIGRYDFLNGHPNYQVRHARRVAESIVPHIKTSKYQITALPERYSDYTYRYFLDVLGHKPQEKDSLDRADELFVLCESICDTIIGNPTWDIAFFAPTKVVATWKSDNVTIYKLVR